MILIIDDDAAVRSSLTFLLKRAGFEPEAVPGPEEGVGCRTPDDVAAYPDGYELYTDYDR